MIAVYITHPKYRNLNMLLRSARNKENAKLVMSLCFHGDIKFEDQEESFTKNTSKQR